MQVRRRVGDDQATGDERVDDLFQRGDGVVEITQRRSLMDQRGHDVRPL
jgi:hypothetical protein